MCIKKRSKTNRSRPKWSYTNHLIMKNLFFALAFVFVGSVSVSASTSNVATEDVTYEYTMMTNAEGDTTCHVRVCWNESETSRKCTDWQEVPCDTDLELEGMSQE